MALPKTPRYSRITFGDDGDRGRRNVVSVSFSAIDLKRPANASTTALLAATAVSNTGSTTLTVTPNPDVPRALTVTVGAGTAADVAGGTIVVSGTNAMGSAITENFVVTNDTPATITGSKAFRTVTSVLVPQQDGASVTVALGTTNKLGIGFKTLSTSAVKILTRSSTGVEALENASASALSSSAVESNTVTPTTTPDGIVGMRAYVLNYNWHINPVNAQPTYGV